MLNIIDVANFFIYLNKKEYKLSLTKTSIVFFCYLSQGWYYAKNDEILFKQDIYVDDKNIFIKELENKIDDIVIVNEYIDNFDISIFHSKEIELLIAIYDYYSQYLVLITYIEYYFIIIHHEEKQ